MSDATASQRSAAKDTALAVINGRQGPSAKRKPKNVPFIVTTTVGVASHDYIGAAHMLRTALVRIQAASRTIIGTPKLGAPGLRECSETIERRHELLRMVEVSIQNCDDALPFHRSTCGLEPECGLLDQ